jgi:predicted transcriptional regulator
MARVLHLFKGEHAGEAAAVIATQAGAGDQVTIALLDAAAPPLPAGVDVRRVPAELSYERLVEFVFASDHVVTW